MKIVADAHIPFLKGAAEQYGETLYLEGKDFTPERIKDADVLIVRTVVRLNREMLEGSRVKLICSATIGFDHIDTGWCEANHIKWVNAPGCNSGSVQQYFTSALIELSRKKDFRIEGKTIGIVGVGNVGKKVAAAAKLLGMNVLLNDPPRERREGRGEFVSLETVKNEADIITFHTPLVRTGIDTTFHLADDRFFDTLAKKPVIINAARGAIIDTSSLKRAIREGLVSGTIIDCWENEPAIDLDCLNMVDMATPHIAGYSYDGKANATRTSLESIARFYGLSNEPAAKISVPMPKNPLIDLNDFPETDRLYGALLHTYSPAREDFALRQSPDKFTFFREHYPLRRENAAYCLQHYFPEEKDALMEWGFGKELANL